MALNNAINRYHDPETGRAILYGYEDEVSVMTNETLDEIRENKRKKAYVESGPTKHYVNCYHEPIAALNDVLDVNEIGAVMKLIPYIRMNTYGQLYYEGDLMTVELMAKAIDRSVRHTKTLAAKLFKEGVLIRDKVGRSYVYSIDDRYHSMGYVIEGAQYTKVLQVKTRTDIRNLTIQSAGVLYKMLPFFNYEHFVLCTNPNEANEGNIYPISHREFSAMVGVHRSVVDSGIKELMRYGFLSKFTSSNGELYIVNPDVATRRRNMNDETSEKVRGLFRLAERQGENNMLTMRTECLPF